jgi:hypothetical protein
LVFTFDYLQIYQNGIRFTSFYMTGIRLFNEGFTNHITAINANYVNNIYLSYRLA